MAAPGQWFASMTLTAQSANAMVAPTAAGTKNRSSTPMACRTSAAVVGVHRIRPQENVLLSPA